MEFVYQAIDKDGGAVKGAVDASDKNTAIKILQDRGLLITNLVERSERSLVFKKLRRVRKEDLVIFSREVATLFEAEITALKVFKLVSTQTSNIFLKEVLTDIADKIQKGSTISKAFAAHPDVFDDFFVNIIQVGEESGTLSRSFTYLADHLEKSHDLNSKVKRALTYPFFVIIVFIAVIILMFVTVIPQISNILIGTGQELPIVTQIVLDVSDFFVSYGYALLAILVGAVIIFVKYAATQSGRRDLDSLKLSLPIVGKLFKMVYISRFASNLSVMVDSGVPLLKSIRSVRGIIGNTVYEDALVEVEEKIRGGAPLSRALETTPVIGKEIHPIVRVGEEAGELTKILKTLTKFYEQEVTGTINTLVDLIQPTIIIALGVGVGGILGAVLLPIYNLASTL